MTEKEALTFSFGIPMGYWLLFSVQWPVSLGPGVFLRWGFVGWKSEEAEKQRRCCRACASVARTLVLVHLSTIITMSCSMFSLRIHISSSDIKAKLVANITGFVVGQTTLGAFYKLSLVWVRCHRVNWGNKRKSKCLRSCIAILAPSSFHVTMSVARCAVAFSNPAQNSLMTE